MNIKRPPIYLVYQRLLFFDICFLRIKLMYWDNERSSFSAAMRSFSSRSLSIVILIFSFNGFILSPCLIIPYNAIEY